MENMEKIEGGQEHEGERYLKLLGLKDLANKEIKTNRGTIEARDFLDICGEHARPLLRGLETLSPEDPRYEPVKNALRSMIQKYIEG